MAAIVGRSLVGRFLKECGGFRIRVCEKRDTAAREPEDETREFRYLAATRR